CSSMAMLYASCPETQPALHTRSSDPSWSLRSEGRILVRRSSHASGSLKNPVTLIRMVLNREVNSPGSSWRRSRYSSTVAIDTSRIRCLIRRIRLGRLYPVKSKARLSLRKARSRSTSASSPGSESRSVGMLPLHRILVRHGTQGALEQFVENGGRLARLARLREEPPRGQHAPSLRRRVGELFGKRGLLLKTAERHPQSPLQRVGLGSQQGKGRPGVPDSAPEAKDAIGVDLE